MVVIHFRSSAVARVELHRNALNRQDPNVRGKKPIEREKNPGRGKRRVCGEMRCLSQRVHSCVGASRPAKRSVRAKNPAQRALDQGLDRYSVFLDLPAAIVRSIIGNDDLVFEIHRRTECSYYTALC